jgi:hypothetical protein
MTKRKSTAASSAKSNAEASAEQKVDAAKTLGVSLSSGDIEKARKQGAIDAEKEAAKDSYQYATDGNLAGDPEDAPRTFPGYDNIMQYEPLLHQGPDAFEAAIAEDAPTPLPEEKVYGLLALERNGQNRTPYVQAAMKRLGLKASELPGGGPGYTNDVHPLSELKDHA